MAILTMDHTTSDRARPSEAYQLCVLTMYSPCTYHVVLTYHTYLWQVSEEFATISAARLLTAQNCWERILFGPRSHHLEKIVARQVNLW